MGLGDHIKIRLMFSGAYDIIYEEKCGFFRGLKCRRNIRVKDIIGKFLTLFEKYCIRLWAYYQELRLIVTKDTKSYRAATHFLAKKNVFAKKKYFVFKVKYPYASVFAAANYYIFLYEWALKKGFTPILDMEYQYSFCQGRIGEDNKWEYCFEQPIMASEAKNQKYAIVGAKGLSDYHLKKTCMDINGDEEDTSIHIVEKDWRKYYANVNQYVRKCWIFKSEILVDFENEYMSRMRYAENVLGVFLREAFSAECYNNLTDSEKEIYDRHPRVPDIETTIGIVKEYVKKWKCDCIFLSTLYQDSIYKFQTAFGDMIITVERQRKKNIMDGWDSRPSFDMTDEELYQKGQKNDLRKQLIPYAKEIIGLSKCDYLIAAKGSGASAALSLNGGKYKDIHILPDENKIVRY